MLSKTDRRSFTVKFSALIGSIAFQNKIFAQSTAQNFTAYDKRIRSFFGAVPENVTPLGVTYTLPVANGKNFAKQNYVIALHYSWETDSKKLEDNLLKNASSVWNSIATTGYYKAQNTDWAGLSGRIKSAVEGKGGGANKNPIVNGDFIKGFVNYFAPYRIYNPNPEEGYFAIVDWNYVPYVKMGFKLDTPAFGAFLTHAFKTSTEASIDDTVWDNSYNGSPRVHSAVKRLYFSGDSASHYGGWVEGAFQSALATTAGIVKAALITKLNTTAQMNSAVLRQLFIDERWPLDYLCTPLIGSKGNNRVTLFARSPVTSLYIRSGYIIDAIGLDSSQVAGGNGGNPSVIDITNVGSIVVESGIYSYTNTIVISKLIFYNTVGREIGSYGGLGVKDVKSYRIGLQMYASINAIAVEIGAAPDSYVSGLQFIFNKK